MMLYLLLDRETAPSNGRKASLHTVNWQHARYIKVFERGAFALSRELCFYFEHQSVNSAP